MPVHIRPARISPGNSYKERLVRNSDRLGFLDSLPRVSSFLAFLRSNAGHHQRVVLARPWPCRVAAGTPVYAARCVPGPPDWCMQMFYATSALRSSAARSSPSFRSTGEPDPPAYQG